MMRFAWADVLGDLLFNVQGDAAFAADTVTADSRKVKKGTVFVAIPGAKADGAKFIDSALAAGASAVVSALPPQKAQCVWVTVSDPRRACARLCRALNGSPDRSLEIFGVTGTNGKTTSAYLLQHLLNGCGMPCGLFTTVEYRDGRRSYPSTNTTPDPETLFGLLAEMKKNDLRAAAMEFSSHALAANRVETLAVKAAIFTNLTGDHLDFHHDMESYFQAKKRLFTDYLIPGGVAAVNLDDAYGKRLASELKNERPDLIVATFGTAAEAEYRIEQPESDRTGSRFLFIVGNNAYESAFPLPGEYNIHNLAGVLTALLGCGIAPEKIDAALSLPFRVPGRLEQLTSPSGADFFVDYAHSDDALVNVLRTARKLGKGKLFVLFGAGGDRDRTKRPRMGRSAAENSDHLLITSDNPRSEDPEAIIAEIVAGLPEKCLYETIPDRREALRRAVFLAQAGDVVVVAGKGHENYQEIKGVRHPFDDREILRELFEEQKHGNH